MADTPDYYEVLQVHPKASPLMVKKAYRTLLMAGAHPDLGGNKLDTQLLTEAYHVLSDPDKRLAYDQRRVIGRAAPTTILISICPHCGVFNRVRSETKLLIARCGKCGQTIGKPKIPTAPLPKLKRWPWQWLTGGLVGILLLAAGTGYWFWNQSRDPLQEAIELEERGQLSVAAEKLQAVLAQEPRNLTAHHHLGRVYEDQKKFDLAVAEYQRAIAIAPESPKSHYLLGKVLMRQGRPADAEAALRRSLEIDPQDVGALVALGNVMVRTERFDEAIALYKQAIPLDARNSDLYFNLGTVYQLKGDPGQAISTYKQALGIEPRHREAMVHLGRLYQERGAIQDALTQFQRAAVLRYEDPDLHFRMADLYRQAGDPTRAIRELQEVQSQSKSNPILQERAQRALQALGGT